jgi:DNA-binding XRE family transcriptional regulator
MAQRKNIELLQKIAQRVKELREEKGVSQQQAYNDTDIHFGRIEAAKMNLSITTIHDICQYFEVSLSDFFKAIS